MTGFLITITVFFSRFILISKGTYNPDILSQVQAAQKTWETGLLQPLLTGYNVPVILGAGSIGLLRSLGVDDPVFAVHMVNVLLGSIAVCFFYQFCSRVLSREAACLGTLLLALFPLFFSMSTMGGSQITSLCFFLAGLNALTQREGPLSRKDWGAVVAFGLMGASRPQDLVFTAIPVMFFIRSRSSGGMRDFIIRIVLFWAAVGAVIILVPVTAFLIAGQIPSGALVRGLYASYMTSDPVQWSPIFRGIQWGWGAVLRDIGIVPLLYALPGSIFLYSKDRRIFLFFLLWICSIFFAYSSLFFKTMPFERYLLFLYLPVLALIAYGSVVLFARKGWYKILIGLVLFGTLVQWEAKVLPVLVFRHQHGISGEYTAWVREHTPKDALVIAGDEEIFIQACPRATIPLCKIALHRTADGIVFNDDLLARDLKGDLYISLGPFYRFLDAGTKVRTRSGRVFRLRKVGEHFFDYWAHSLTTLQVFRLSLYQLIPEG